MAANPGCPQAFPHVILLCALHPSSLFGRVKSHQRGGNWPQEVSEVSEQEARPCHKLSMSNHGPPRNAYIQVAIKGTNFCTSVAWLNALMVSEWLWIHGI